MRQLFYLLSFLLVIFSCSKDNEIIEEEKYLSVDLSEIEITKQAQDVVIKINTNDCWNASADRAFVQLDKSEGSGSNELCVSFLENTDYSSRRATITISTTTLKKIITVVQSQNDAIILKDGTISFTWQGGEQKLNLQSNIDYSFSIETSGTEDWISVEKPTNTRALSSSELQVVAKENRSNLIRRASVIIKGKDINLRKEIQQDAYIDLESISIDGDREIVFPDMNSVQLTACVLPENVSEKDIIWSSDNDKIAKVNQNGMVTPVSNGETSINVTHKSSGKTANVKVIVRIKATSLTVEHPSGYSGTYGYVIDPGIKITPQNAYISDLIVTSSDPDIAFYEDGKIYCGNKSGQTWFNIKLPYSNLSKTFDVNVVDMYKQFGGVHINQRGDYTEIVIGGRLGTRLKSDYIYINSVSIVDGNDKVVAASFLNTEIITILRNGTNDVGFYTNTINITNKYGVYLWQDMTPVLENFRCCITYSREFNGPTNTIWVNFDTHNWAVDPYTVQY